jgi:hypothetical protein
MTSSTVGILGSFYQIFIRREDEIDGSSRRSMGRKIIVALAYSDLLASIGIFLRSGLWSFFKEIMPYDDGKALLLFFRFEFLLSFLFVKRYGQCLVLFYNIGVGSTFLHCNMALDFYLCVQHETIFEEPTDK